MNKTKFNILIISQNISKDINTFIPRITTLGLDDEMKLCLSFKLYNQNCMLVDQDDLSIMNEFSIYENGCFRRMTTLDNIDAVIPYDLNLEKNSLEKLLIFLNVCHERNIHLINPLETFKYNLNKNYLFEMQTSGIPMLKIYKYNEIPEKRKLVIKPLIGHKAEGIALHPSLQNISDIDSEKFLQEYSIQFGAGEFSLIFIGGEYQYGISRHKSDNSQEFNNASKGGYVKKYVPSLDEILFAKRVIDFHHNKKLIIDYCRVDYIKTNVGCMLTETEIACPILAFKFDDSSDLAFMKLSKHIVKKLQPKLRGLV